ncbi:MAG: class I SAM-dependent methyltransferase [candidate division WS1 bacterium]|nr:class I SAM-dependent methyltransferase [candidate division WS1 bacterium]
MRALILKAYEVLARLYGRISKKYYFEDFVRVYPDGLSINRYGLKRPATSDQLKNFLNHQKFYAFAGQFAYGKTVADIGCGSGYGCSLLKDAGANMVHGTDVSKHAIRFARKHYGHKATFSIQSITSMDLYHDDQYDLTICSEVLEHIKEYGKERQALAELARITRKGGTVVIGTPNSELLEDHGFSFEEMDALANDFFTQYCIFENALVPLGPSKQNWEKRLSEGRTGVIVSEKIKLDETVLPDGREPQIKAGIPSGIFKLGNLNVTTHPIIRHVALISEEYPPKNSLTT